MIKDLCIMPKIFTIIGMQLTEQDKTEYYYRSYIKADGLWFVKAEECFGFEKALDLDRQVWEVLPKIQARFFQSKLKHGRGIDALCTCLTAKLEWDHFQFQVSKTHNLLKISIQACPWHQIMVKSGRETLSGKVGAVICSTEYAVWAAEFGDDLDFRLRKRICGGQKQCHLEFSKAD